MSRILGVVALLGVAGFGAGCRDADPTAVATGDVSVHFEYTISSTDNALLASEMLWNGESFGRDSCTGAGTQKVGVIPGVKSGTNTFAVRIANQRVSPSRYSVTGHVTATRWDGSTRKVPISIVNQSLSTGQLVTLVLDFSR